MNVAAGLEQAMMTAPPPGGPGPGGVRTLEVRWIFPGPLAATVAGWFGRFPAETESRTDTYLLDPRMGGLSVKIRAGRALEVKRYCGSPGMLDLPGRAHGHLQAWQKWSFPFRSPGPASGDPGSWQTVRKRRQISRFPLAGEQSVAGGRGLAGESGCAVELTQIRVRDETWWSLGFEVTGPAGLLHRGLDAAAAIVFAQDLPAGAEMTAEYSRSYAEWLLTPGPSRGRHTWPFPGQAGPEVTGPDN